MQVLAWAPKKYLTQTSMFRPVLVAHALTTPQVKAKKTKSFTATLWEIQGSWLQMPEMASRAQ